MSFLERTKGLPYGSIPYEEILSKLEETDMSFSTEPEVNYNNYIRSELVDYTLDKPFLEYDTIKRDSTTSKVALNLRYNGSRGSYDYPKHPDLFIGFTDADPRGVENLPRMNEYQEQINRRMPNLEIRMGYNADQHECERPWTNQSLNNCRRDLQTSLKYNTKVFIDELNGRALNNNMNVNYDHNKPQLIYKDLLPNSLTGENCTSKQNTGYTVSSVPFVKTSSQFAGSYDNQLDRQVQHPMANSNVIRNVSYDQIIADSNKATYGRTNNRQTETKVQNFKSGHIFTDTFENDATGKTSFNPYDLSGKNIQNELYPNELTNNDNTNVRTDRPNRVNNHISDIEVKEYVFTDMDVRRHDTMRYSNANTYMDTHINSSDIVNTEMGNKKNSGIKGDNNILLINSSIIIPDHSFNNIEKGRHYALNDTKKIVRQHDVNMPHTLQVDHTNKHNTYKFTDNIANNYNTSIEQLNEVTAESINKPSNLQRENKISNLEYDNEWSTSLANNVGKSQKVSRTSGTDDHVVIDMPVYNDFDTNNGGSVLGTKSLRGDHSVNTDTFSNISNFVY